MALIPSEVRREIEDTIGLYKRLAQPGSLVRYLESVQVNALLAATLAENKADINYRNAQAVVDALEATGYRHRTEEITYILSSKPEPPALPGCCDV
jgi:hypothetical protein